MWKSAVRRLNSSRSDNLLLGKVVLVLVFNAQALESSELLALDSFNLLALVLKPLTDLATFFEVVQPLLFLDFVILCDLVPNKQCDK